MMTSIIKEAEKYMDYDHDEHEYSGFTKRDLEKKLLIRSAMFT